MTICNAIDTKLDLAKAYLDMGDTEGAKNLLDEVVSEGSDSQVDEAKKIIALHAVVAELAKTVALQAKASAAHPKGDKNAEKIKEKNLDHFLLVISDSDSICLDKYGIIPSNSK